MSRSETGRRIVIVRGDGIGDALVLAPLIAALRDAGHALDIVLSTRSRGVYAHGVFGRVHCLDRIPWPAHGSTAASYERTLREGRAANYEIALVASEEPEAYRLARELGAARRIGFTTGWSKPLKTLWAHAELTRALARPASAADVREHEVRTLFRLGAGLHAETEPTREIARLRPLVLDDVTDAYARAIVVQLSPKFHGRGLDARAYGLLLYGLARRYEDVCAVFLAEDALFAEEVRTEAVRAAGGGASRPDEIAFEAPENVERWKATLGGAQAIVTPDSGAAHVAGMCGVPCVDLFPRTPHAERDRVRWAPWAGPSRTVVLDGEPERLSLSVLVALDALSTPAATVGVG